MLAEWSVPSRPRLALPTFFGRANAKEGKGTIDG
jgi:hypothetical protein